MSTLTDARAAIVAAIRSANIREANVAAFAYSENSSVTFPRISVEVNEMRYYRTMCVCKRAGVDVVIRLEVAAEAAGGCAHLVA